MKRRSRPSTAEATINVTSLLDVTFVLLISFMVVAPALKHDVPIELPGVSQGKSEYKEPKVTIQVKTEGLTTEYYVNGGRTTLETIASDVAMFTKESDPEIAVEADRSVPWEGVARLMNQLRLEGLNKVSIVTEQRS